MGLSYLTNPCTDKHH